MTDGSLASSPSSLSAGGQDEQPWEVKSSTTARGSACAGRMTATIAQTPRAAPDHRAILVKAIIATVPELLGVEPCRVTNFRRLPVGSVPHRTQRRRPLS